MYMDALVVQIASGLPDQPGHINLLAFQMLGELSYLIAINTFGGNIAKL
jgi:hypothetical protein